MVWAGNRDIAWCPGCGDFGIRNALEAALKDLALAPNQVVMTSGIGQAAKMPQYLETNYFNGLHGRSLPVAVGIKLARPELTVIAVSGDGCHLGEGGNHFIHTIRRNLDLTILICDNRVYALTKGQSGPTTDLGVKNALDPQGNENTPLNPLTLAIVMGAPFVARGFAGDAKGLTQLLKEAIAFKGTAVVDVMQPCVSFNKINTYQWYSERIYSLGQPARTKAEALEIAGIWGDKIPVGILYRDERVTPRAPGNRLFRQGCTEDAVSSYIEMRHRDGPGH